MSKFAVALIACLLFASSAVAGDMMRVQLRSGKVLIGEKDARSTAERLVLRHRVGSTVRLRSVRPSEIEQVRPYSPPQAETGDRSQAQIAQKLLSDE